VYLIYTQDITRIHNHKENILHLKATVILNKLTATM